MPFPRTILDQLQTWAASPRRKPLVLRGARQVGKTVAVELFGRSFDTFVSLNLEREADASLFERNLSAKDLYQAILLAKRIRAHETGSTLLFLDEVQACPRAVEQLRFFYEDLPELAVIAAGSLLEIALVREHLSFPVGRVEHLRMYPLSFVEFLNALGNEPALTAYHTVPCPEYALDTLMTLFHRYALVGGTPEVVDLYREAEDVTALAPVYDSLLTSYIDDASKYARNPTMQQVLRFCIETVPFEAGKRIKFTGFGQSNYRAREAGEALRTLERALMIYLLYPTTGTEIPIRPDLRKPPKLQFLDTGLLNHVAGLQHEHFLHDDLHAFYRGLLAEHVVGQELLCHQPQSGAKLCFWVRNKSQSAAEVDFVLQHGGHVIPVEVKAGKAGSLRSLHQFMDRAQHDLAVRLHAGPLGMEEVATANGKRFRLLNLPYFLAALVPRYLDEYVGFPS